MTYQFNQANFTADLKTRMQQTKSAANVLVLSGGGSNGAFGAGFLCGWRGGIPEFDIVTGVSTGGLMATGAFLRDTGLLQAEFTNINNSDIKGNRCPLMLPFVNSLYKSDPLRKMIARYISNNIIDMVANEAVKGRQLFVASTNLNLGKLHIWDLTALAVNREYDRYRAALLASASAEMIFPPVEIDGVMHGDGGVKANIFLRDNMLPALAMGHQHGADVLPVKQKPTIYAIVNGALSPEYPPIKGDMISLAERSLNCLMDTNNIGCLYQIKYWADKLNYNFRLAYIPGTLKALQSFTFDKDQMGELFEEAAAIANRSWPWMNIPDVTDLAK